MCIAVWALEHPDYALILGENRDEYLDRPTQNAHWHSFEKNLQDNEGSILSGRDEQAGGSWFGLNRTGRVAIITNINEPYGQYESTRGCLISSFLLSKSTHPLEDELGKIVSPDSVFAGFNLLLLAPSLRLDSNSLSYGALFVTNHGGGGALTSRPLTTLERDCGCMSNGIDGQDANDWPKVKHAMKDLSAVLGAVGQEKRELVQEPREATVTTEYNKENLYVNLDTTSTVAEKGLETQLVDELFQILSWRSSGSITARSQLRNTVQVIPIVLEESTKPETETSVDTHTNSSSPKKTPAVYGTRLSTVLLIKRNGEVYFVERDIWARGADGRSVVNVGPQAQREFRFNLGLDAIRNSQGSSPISTVMAPPTTPAAPATLPREA